MKHEGLSFCRLELQLAKQQILGLVEALSKSFEEIRTVYSGRGFHIHVFDESTFFWTRRKCLGLVRALTRKGYLTDEWVRAGGMRLIRLPHSPNGLVSRVAMPLRPEEIETFDPLKDSRCIPRFLQCRD